MLLKRSSHFHTVAAVQHLDRRWSFLSLPHRRVSVGTVPGARNSFSGSGKNSSLAFWFKEMPLELVFLIASPGLSQVLCRAVPLAFGKVHVLPWLHVQLGQLLPFLGTR